MSTTSPAQAHVAAARQGAPTGGLELSVHREPVVTADGAVAGYVVSVVGSAEVPAQGTAPERAAAAMAVQDAYLRLDLAALVADRYAFVPATPAMLDGHLPAAAAPGRLVLDLPAGYELRPDAVERAHALRALGAELALLGYRGTPDQVAMLPALGFVVVDVRAVAQEQLGAIVHAAHAGRARVLASGVTDGAVMDHCFAVGVDGLRDCYAERRPTGSHAGSRVLRAGELQCLAVLHLLEQPEVGFSEVAQVIDTDPVLTLRVLHLVNSGAFGVAHQVDTVHQAVVLLGARELSTLVTALLVEARPDAMDSLWFILARALTCEEIAGEPAAYTVGMLSALASQLNVPAEAILEKVGVSAAVSTAVAHEAGPLGAVLRAVRAHERTDPSGVLTAGWLPAEVSAVYVRCLADALATARTVTRSPV